MLSSVPASLSKLDSVGDCNSAPECCSWSHRDALALCLADERVFFTVAEAGVVALVVGVAVLSPGRISTGVEVSSTCHAISTRLSSLCLSSLDPRAARGSVDSASRRCLYS